MHINTDNLIRQGCIIMHISKMDDSFNKDKAIGDNGETAVSFLIQTMSDWKCIKFGVENHMEDLKKTVKREINPITKKIKNMPDFVAFNIKTGETFFIEVKYRSNSNEGKYLFSYLNEYNEYWKGTKLIIVRPEEPHFIYVDLEKITPEMKKLIELSKNNWKEYWDFNGLEQDINKLFPDLSDESIEEAKGMILRKN